MKKEDNKSLMFMIVALLSIGSTDSFIHLNHIGQVIGLSSSFQRGFEKINNSNKSADMFYVRGLPHGAFLVMFILGRQWGHFTFFL